MDLKSLLARVDHTLLDICATQSDFFAICIDGLEYGVASVCVPPSAVRLCAGYLEGKLPVCTVVGFPNGYGSSEVKAFEAEDAIKHGAAEIDMVINLGHVKDKKFSEVLADIRAVREVTEKKILKVIIETVKLSHEEKIKLCEIVSESGADFIKTSTGFAGGGATFEDVSLLSKHVAPSVQVKAAGGINSLEDAYRFVELGASRLGTSRIIKLVKGLDVSGY